MNGPSVPKSVGEKKENSIQPHTKTYIKDFKTFQWDKSPGVPCIYIYIYIYPQSTPKYILRFFQHRPTCWFSYQNPQTHHKNWVHRTALIPATPGEKRLGASGELGRIHRGVCKKSWSSSKRMNATKPSLQFVVRRPIIKIRHDHNDHTISTWISFL